MIRAVGYVRQAYTYEVQLDLSKYFGTLNHERLMNLLRKRIKDTAIYNEDKNGLANMRYSLISWKVWDRPDPDSLGF